MPSARGFTPGPPTAVHRIRDQYSDAFRAPNVIGQNATFDLVIGLTSTIAQERDVFGSGLE